MSGLTYRNSDGELVDVPTVAATRFKNEFGAIFEQATVRGAVAITKHNTPRPCWCPTPNSRRWSRPARRC